jgi:SAM-dependent methyltransferase
MESDEPSLAMLSQLATSRDVGDRAFVASALAFRLGTDDRNEITAVYDAIRETARREHAELRARIRARAVDRGNLLEILEQEPLETRDHLIEEILDIAYPPLEGLASPPRDTVPYSPSGFREILFALEHGELGPGTTFVDLGSGLGKVVLLAALLTGAEAYGVELDPSLVAYASAAAASHRLDRAHFVQGDIRDAPLPPADAYYLFIPVHRSVDVAERLANVASERSIRVFSQPLDERRVPFLRASGEASYWLTKYESSRTRSEK